ncbi:MAG: hypothetical protein AAGG44_06780 [Planctomycetota bacterium]
MSHRNPNPTPRRQQPSLQLGCLFSVGVLMFFAMPGQGCGQESEHSPDEPASKTDRILLVVGAAGDPKFAVDFEEASFGWKDTAARNQMDLVEIKPTGELSARSLLESAISESKECRSLWIVMIGHGTFARNTAKFNLPGPDVSALELAAWLAPLKNDMYLVHCFSASAPFMKTLSGKNRIVVTSTKSGAEYNYSRFGQYLAAAINDLSNDLDHDDSVSLLEAFLAANNQTQQFYEQESRLATEHALLNDNADALGTPGEFYTGIRPSQKAEAGKEIDGVRASRVILMQSPSALVLSSEESKKRLDLELQLDELRRQKTRLTESQYLDRLETLMLKLSALYVQEESSAEESTEKQVDSVGL